MILVKTRILSKLTVDARAGADLVLPLRGHDLSVDTGDVDAGVQAGTVVSLNNVTAVDLASTDTTVVGTLGTGETTTGPAVGPAVGAEKGVLLFKTEPELLLGVGLHQTGSIVAVVELVGATIGVPGLAENKDVVALAEGVGEDSDGTEVDIGVVTRGLAGGGTVEVPFGELVNGFDGLRESLASDPLISRLFYLLRTITTTTMPLFFTRDTGGCRHRVGISGLSNCFR